MIRKANPSDIPGLIELGIEALSLDPAPALIIDREKVRATAIECVSSAKHFFWVSEIDGEVVGGVAAMAYPLQFFQRNQCSVIMCYCRSGNEGGWLLKKLFDWYQSRPMIKCLEFTIEKHMDHRIPEFLESLGLNKEPPAYSHYKGVSK